MTVKVIDSFRLIVAAKNGSNIGIVEADADNDTLTLDAGVGVNFEVSPAGDKITIINETQAEIEESVRQPIFLRADDSSIKKISPGENFGLLGSGAVTTSSNAEGDVTITAPLTLSSYTNDPGFIADITAENIQDLNNVTITSVADLELLQYDNASSAWINRTISEAGFANVSTSGVYGDLTTRPNITFDGDLSGSTGGQLAGGASTVSLTLANSGVVAGTYSGFTVDAKGRITGVAGDIVSSETLQSVTDRGATTTNRITVANLTLGNIIFPSAIGSDGTALTVQNGQLKFLPISSNANFRVSADDSTERTVNSGEVLEILGSGSVTTTSDSEAIITINVPTTISSFTNDANYTKVGSLISQFVNDQNFVQADNVFSVAADDSTQRVIGNQETIRFSGSGNITTSSDAEGNITIDSSPTLFDITSNGSSTSTDIDLQSNVTLGTNTTNLLTVNSKLTGQYPLTFDGTTLNGNTTRFEIEDPGGARTITFPDATGTVAFVGADISTFNNDANYATTSGNVATATALQTARNFSISGVVTGNAVSFDGTGAVALNTSFTSNLISQFVNDAGYTGNALQEGANVSVLVNDLNYMSKFFISADDSTAIQINGDEQIKIYGGGNVTTASDAEGNIQITSSNDLSDYNNDVGFNTQNDTITLTGDVSGTGRTTINTTLNVALSNVIPGTYNQVTVDTKGIVQDAENINYVQSGEGVSNFINDAGYITSLGTSLRFIGDDSTGFGVPIPGNDIRMQGDGGVSVVAANETITISGPLNANGLLQADVSGSIFADDSTRIIDGETGKITTSEISTSVADISSVIKLTPLASPPGSPTQGMIAIASGESGEWNPGGLNPGTLQMVVYLGSAWVPIAEEAGGV